MAWADRKHPDTICLFDVDGTLTPARRRITPDVHEFLIELRKKVVIGFVGGSDLVKQQEQLGDDVLQMFDFAFAENGLTAYRSGEVLATESFIGWIGEEKYQDLVNFMLEFLSKIRLPKKRGTFIEFRNGMVNVSPVGRNANQQERDEFEAYDKIHGVRAKFVDALKQRFPDLSLTYSIGGQISFDVFPTGWDKTYCLKHIKNEGFKTIHFCGDKTFKGGNDFEIFSHPDVQGHTVASPQDSVRIMRELFFTD